MTTPIIGSDFLTYFHLLSDKVMVNAKTGLKITANRQENSRKIYDRRHSLSPFIGAIPQNYANLEEASTATAAFNHALH